MPENRWIRTCSNFTKTKAFRYTLVTILGLHIFGVLAELYSINETCLRLFQRPMIQMLDDQQYGPSIQAQLNQMFVSGAITLFLSCFVLCVLAPPFLRWAAIRATSKEK